MTHGIIDVSLGDPTPTDPVERQQFVAQVASLQMNILKPKLEYMITKVHEILELTDNDRDYDQALKGTIYAFREIIRWGESCFNEHIANAQEAHDEEDYDNQER